jgi:hypothetical protein
MDSPGHLWSAGGPPRRSDSNPAIQPSCKPRSADQGCHADDSGRTDGRMMAAGSSVTWTHCSVRYEVT